MAPTVPIEFIGQKESKKGWLSQPMGKSRKYSKGYSSGFVPDYRHAVETMGESEGFGGAGRVEIEMTVSEDSCAPNRKCISLNVDGYDGLGVPMQVLSLSKMSRLERKDLEYRLKNELEQVRVLQRKVASLNSNVVVLSPNSDIRSCSDGRKRPVVEVVDRSFEVAPQNKKRAPPGRNGAHTKKNSLGRCEPLTVVPHMPNATLMKQCENLLNRLMGHQFGWVFNTPVDVKELNIPDYFNVIKHPMDLGTVKSKIISLEYSSPLEFAADVRLTFTNAKKYNPPTNDVHVMADTLSKQFESRWKAIEKKLPVIVDVEPVPPRAVIDIEMETPMNVPHTKMKKVSPVDNEVKSEPVKRIMTAEDKQKLSTELETLIGELPESIIDFLNALSDQTSEGEIEIDIDAISDDTLFKLRKMLDDYLLDKQQKQAKAEPCEMELIHESGFSNSSLQPCKGNNPVDEDIDIVGGNEAPISSRPPVEIEKDAAHKNSKCSSSSSSSSESGSSSDSDSGSSSGSESDAVKASGPGNSTKENEGSVEILDQKRSGLGDAALGDQTVNELVKSESKPIAAEADAHLDGESAPPERQVSPEKLYRAAILRNRFADTILKAREKALEKGEKRDPEKMQMEREERERLLKEEKARLQAEAKAAEEARRKAEAEAAAEARRKRELEREAARQALIQMEKTVDINENGRFMEDLEMFKTVQDEQVPDLLEETSIDHSLTRFASFKLQGSSNPLEQLGLYMKEDDDDEEEVEAPQSVSEPVKDEVDVKVVEEVKDVEEGEID